MRFLKNFKRIYDYSMSLRLQFILFTLVLITPCFNLFASPDISISLKPRKITIHENATLSLSFIGVSETADINPRFERSKDVDILPRGTSSQVSIVNGALRQSIKTLRYSVRPTTTGKLLTPRGIVIIKGRTYNIEPIELLVSKGNNIVPPGHKKQKPVGTLLLKQTIHPQKAYVGQQVVNIISLFYDVPISNVQLLDATSNGFIQKNIGDAINSTTRQAGKNVRSLSVKRALFAIKPGSIVIPSRTVTGIREAHFPMQNPFGMSLGSIFRSFKQENFSVDSNSLKVDIARLPENNRYNLPPHIVGLVSANISENNIRLPLNDEYSVTIDLVTDGNINSIPSLIPEETDGLEVYSKKANTTSFENSGRLFQKKVNKITFVATEEGKYILEIPEIRYFDPIKNEYKIERIKPITIVTNGYDPSKKPIEVKRPKTSENDSSQLIEKPSENTEEKTFKIINRKAKTIFDRLDFHTIIGFILCILITLIAILALLAIRKKSHKTKVLVKEIKNANSPAELLAIIQKIKKVKDDNQSFIDIEKQCQTLTYAPQTLNTSFESLKDRLISIL